MQLYLQVGGGGKEKGFPERFNSCCYLQSLLLFCFDFVCLGGYKLILDIMGYYFHYSPPLPYIFEMSIPPPPPNPKM